MSTYEEDVALLHKALSEGVTGVPDMDLSDTALQPQSLDPCRMAGVADEDATEEELAESTKDGYVFKLADAQAWENIPNVVLALGDVDSTPLDNGDVGDDRPAHYVVYREGK